MKCLEKKRDWHCETDDNDDFEENCLEKRDPVGVRIEVKIIENAAFRVASVKCRKFSEIGIAFSRELFSHKIHFMCTAFKTDAKYQTINSNNEPLVSLFIYEIFKQRFRSWFIVLLCRF